MPPEFPSALDPESAAGHQLGTTTGAPRRSPILGALASVVTASFRRHHDRPIDALDPRGRPGPSVSISGIAPQVATDRIVISRHYAGGQDVHTVRIVQIPWSAPGDAGMAVLPDDLLRAWIDDDDPVVEVVVQEHHAVWQLNGQ